MSGELRDSIHLDDQGNVTVTAPHAALIELGTSERAATPYLALATLAMMPNFEDAVAEAVREVARGV